jgi:hypothetical protein
LHYLTRGRYCSSFLILFLPHLKISFDRGLFSVGCAPDPLLCHVSILSSNTLYFPDLAEEQDFTQVVISYSCPSLDFETLYSLTTDQLNYDPVKQYLFLVLLKPLKEEL